MLNGGGRRRRAGRRSLELNQGQLVPLSGLNAQESTGTQGGPCLTATLDGVQEETWGLTGPFP